MSNWKNGQHFGPCGFVARRGQCSQDGGLAASCRTADSDASVALLEGIEAFGNALFLIGSKFRSRRGCCCCG